MNFDGFAGFAGLNKSQVKDFTESRRFSQREARIKPPSDNCIRLYSLPMRLLYSQQIRKDNAVFVIAHYSIN